MAAYLNREREKLDKFVQENETGRRNEEIMDGDEPIVPDNSIFEAFEHDPDAFFTLCGFKVERFRRLFDLVKSALTVPKRGRKRVIGPMEGSSCSSIGSDRPIRSTRLPPSFSSSYQPCISTYIRWDS
jgi:hypothetical protein